MFSSTETQIYRLTGLAYLRGGTGLVAFLAALAIATPHAQSETLFWDAGDTLNSALDPANGIWDAGGTPNWATALDGSGTTTFTNRSFAVVETPGDTAVFTDAGGEIDVTVSGVLTPERIEVAGNGYRFITSAVDGGAFGETLAVEEASTVTFALADGVTAQVVGVDLVDHIVIASGGLSYSDGQTSGLDTLSVGAGATFTLTETGILNHVDVARLPTLNNAGQTQIDGVLTGDLSSTESGLLELNNMVTGGVTNAGTAVLQGMIGGALRNEAAGNVNLAGQLDVQGGVLNNGLLTVNNSDTLIVTSADIQNLEGAEFNANGSILGDIGNAAGATLDVGNNAQITGDVTNDGLMTFAGDVDGSLVNSAAGPEGLIVDGVASVSGAVQNSGDLIIADQLSVQGGVSQTGLMIVQTDATLDLSGAAVSLDRALINDGSLTVDGLLIADTVTNSVGQDLTLTGELRADLNNQGTATLEGQITGNLENSGQASLTGGDLSVTGNLSNSGELRLDTGDVLVSESVTNTGLLTIDSGQELSAGQGVLNSSGAEINVNGALAADVENASGAILDVGPVAQIQGDLVNSGQVSLGGALGGTVTNFADQAAGGVFVDHDTVVQGRIQTNGYMLVRTENNLQASGGVENDGTLQITGSLLGDVANTGQLDVATNGALDGILTNSGAGETRIAGTLSAFNNAAELTVMSDGQILDASQNSGSLMVEVGGTAGADLTNEGTVVVQGVLGTATSRLENQAGVVQVDAGGTVAGLVRNGAAAQILADGGAFTGDIVNAASGLFELRADTAVTGIFDNDGTLRGNTEDALRLTVDGLFQSTGEITNEGVSGTVGTFTISAAEIENNGTVSNGVALDGNVINRGLLDAPDRIAGDLQNEGVANLEGSVGGQITNSVSGILNTTGDLAAEGLQNFGQFTIAAGDRVTSDTDVVNNGELQLAGELAGPLMNEGTVRLAQTGVVDGDLSSNNALFLNGGSIEGTLTAQAGSVIISEDSLVSGVVLNQAGQIVVSAGNQLTSVRLENEGAARLTVDGVLNSDLVNAGEAILNSDFDGSLLNMGTVFASELNGAVENRAGATLAASGDLSATVRNDGTLSVGGDVTGTLLNTGTVEVTGQAAGSIRNFGDLSLTGGLSGALTNDGGQVLLGGLVTGDISTQNGQIRFTDGASVSGALVSDQAFSVGLGQSVSLGSFLNTGLDATIEGILTTDAQNSGFLTFGPSGALAGDLRNAEGGTLLFANGGQIDGDLINDGSVLLSLPTAPVDDLDRSELPNASGDVVTVTGGLAGSGSFTFDVDLSDDTGDSAAQADRVVFLGPAQGDFVVNLNILDPASLGEQEQDLVLIDVNEDLGAANDFTFTLGMQLPVSERLVYLLSRQADGQGDLVLADALNPALGALAGNVALTQSLIGSVVNRPTSPFVVGLGVDDGNPCGTGGWVRASYGTATSSGTTTTDIGVSSPSEIDATYYGIQAGGDFACFQGHFNGWDLAFGGVLGVNEGSTSQPVFAIDPLTGQVGGTQLSTTQAEFQQLYLGSYLTAAKGPLALDLQLRGERTEFNVSNFSVAEGAGLGLDGAEFSSTTTTLSGAATYAFAMENGWTLAPSAGFAFSRSGASTISFEDGAVLEIEKSSREIGFLGGAISRSVLGKDGRSLTNYFALGTLYQDFADPLTSVFTASDGSQTRSASDNLGAYGEVSFGVSYIKILSPKQDKRAARQFSASARADARFSGTLDGGSITAQARWQF